MGANLGSLGIRLFYLSKAAPLVPDKKLERFKDQNIRFVAGW